MVDPVAAHPRRPRRPARGTARRSVSLHPEYPLWANCWAIAWGMLLLFAALVPRWQGGTRWILLPGDLAKADLGSVVVLLLPLALAILAIVAGVKLRDGRLGAVLLVGGAVAFLLGFLLAGDRGRLFRLPRDKDLTVVLVAALLLATPFVAAGNHLRKSHPDRLAPRRMALAGGIVVVVVLLVPMFEDQVEDFSLLGVALDPDTWKVGWSLSLGTVALFLWGLLGIASGAPRFVPELASSSSWLLRVILVGVPLLVVLNLEVLGPRHPRNAAIGVGVLLKASVLLYAPLALLGVGLAARAGASLRDSCP